MASLNVIKSEDELTSVLRIANALSYYSGSYYCIVKNEIGETYSTQAQLQVKGTNYIYCAITITLCCKGMYSTVRRKCLTGENFDEFDKSKLHRQKFPYQYFAFQ